MNETDFSKASEQAAAFQKMWVDSMTRLMQTAFSSSPTPPPPEILGQIRAGMFQALAHSWEEFMRSPQFLDGMKQWMENAINFRKLTNDFMAKVRNEIQAPSRDDIDTIMLTVRHMEKRLLDRVDQLAQQVGALNGKATVAASPKNTGARRSAASKKSPKQRSKR
jgi:hypothetical protein